MAIQQWCLKVLTVILEQPVPKKPWIWGWGVFVHTIWGWLNPLRRVRCHEPWKMHVHSHKISGCMNSWSPFVDSPGDPRAPVSCSKIYTHGKISKIFFNEKINKLQTVYTAWFRFSLKCYIYMNIPYLRQVGSRERITFTVYSIYFILNYFR